ncbi:MAG: MATE family efflux transporter, partial [Clostridiales bacterium]|nr:MATE family efflux transporter [Clostridiales bacterium]
QSIGKALLSTVISLIREVVFGVGFALILPIFFGLDGVLYSMPVSDVLTFLVAAAAIRSTYRALSAQEPGEAKTEESIKLQGT